MQFGDSFIRGGDVRNDLLNDYGRSPSQRSIKSEDDSPDRKHRMSPKKGRRKILMNDSDQNLTSSSQAELE